MTNEEIPSASVRRGRPKDPQLRLQILSAAREHFFQHGVQAASMDGIASSAGVSNRTIYSHFPSKDALLWAVLVNESEHLRPKFPSKEPRSATELRNQWVEFGVQFIEMLTSPNLMSMGRVLVSECIRHPDMAKQFYQWGPGQVQKALTDVVSFGISKRWIDVEDPREVALQLLALWHGTWHFEQQLGLRGRVSKKESREIAEKSVELVWKAHCRASR